MKTQFRFLCSALLCIFLAFSTSSKAQQSDPSLPAGCKADPAANSSAEAALYLEDWGKARGLYRDLMTADPSSLEARAGLIRVMLGEDNIADALKEATALAQANPNSVIAATALGETYLRRGEISMATPVLSKAIVIDQCYARALLEAARLENLSGYHASAAHHLAEAHALRPNDEQINVAWLFSQPPVQRYPMLETYLQKIKYLNPDDREDLKSDILNGEARMNSRCTVSAPTEGTKTHLFINAQNDRMAGKLSIDTLINGKKHRLALTTDGNEITFNRAMAQNLGLTPLAKISYARIYDGGRVHFYLTNIPSIRVGDVEYKNCIGVVVDEPDSGLHENLNDANVAGVDGHIGSMFFADFLVDANSPKNELALTPLPPQAMTPDSDGLLPWSDVSKSVGADVPSIEGGSWAQHNRIVSPQMSKWSPTFEYRNHVWMPTVIGPGPEVLFSLELSDPWARISTNAVHQATTFEEASKNKSAPIHGYFYSFAGLIFPVNSWTNIRFDEFSKHTKLETSGTLGGDALRQTAFTLDLRDNLVQVIREKK